LNEEKLVLRTFKNIDYVVPLCGDRCETAKNDEGVIGMWRNRDWHPILGPIAMGIVVLVFAVVMLGMAVALLNTIMPFL
jgi:hypothetical protein